MNLEEDKVMPQTSPFNAPKVFICNACGCKTDYLYRRRFGGPGELCNSCDNLVRPDLCSVCNEPFYYDIDYHGCQCRLNSYNQCWGCHVAMDGLESLVSASRDEGFSCEDERDAIIKHIKDLHLEVLRLRKVVKHLKV